MAETGDVHAAERFAADVDPWGGGRLPPAACLQLGDGMRRRPQRSRALPTRKRVPADAVNGSGAAAHYGADAILGSVVSTPRCGCEFQKFWPEFFRKFWPV